MINKTFRLFISSTFSDFLMERSILNNEIFVDINEFCKSRGYNFQLIDLRWGINNESAINQNTLAICLNEVNRCRKLSPKPNFLLMAGERYGWIPLPAAIPQKELEQLLSLASAEEQSVIRKWYLFDDNEIGGEYYLKTRSGRFANDNEWTPEESRIRLALLSCAQKDTSLPEETKKKLTSSATEQEILEGLLSSSFICDNAIAIFRVNYPDKDPDQSRIDELKQRVKEKMAKDGCIDNVVELNWNEDYPKRFKETVISSLKANITREIERLEAEKESISDRSALAQFSENGIVIQRKAESAALVEYEQGTVNAPLFVIGGSGSGKSTLLAQYVLSRTDNVFYLFYGLDENSYTLVDGLSNLADRIAERFITCWGISISLLNITEGFCELIHSIPAEEKVIIVIDGLDSFQDIYEMRESIFPSFLPSNVKIIISVAEGEICDRFTGESSNTLTVGEFSKAESESILALFLREKNRRIVSETQNEAISGAIDDGATPLSLRLMTEICAKWHSADGEVSMPRSAEEIALQHITNMFVKFGHNRELVLYALALIASSPYGITEEELQLLLLRFAPVKEYFVSEDRYNHSLDKLPFVIWSRLFYDLQGCLTLAKSNGFITVTFSHSVFYHVFAKAYPEYCSSARSMLKDYYVHQDSLFDFLMPNIRKALVLPYLYKASNEIGKLAELYNDLDFLDSVVKARRVDGAISNIQLIIKSGSSLSNKEYFLALFNCLQNNRGMLNCYYDGLRACARQAGLYESEVPIGAAVKATYADSAFFPYSSSAKVVWRPDCREYAVYYQSYVYICEADTNTEICRIFVQPSINGVSKVVKGVIWISDTRIAVPVNFSVIYIYDIGDPVPNLITSIDRVSTNASQIKFSSKHNILFVQTGNSIAAFSTVDFEQLYSLPLRQKQDIGIDVIDDELYFMHGNRRIDAVSVPTGKLLRSIKVRIRPSFYDPVFHAIKKDNWNSVHRVSNDLWLVRETFSISLALVSSSAPKADFIHPPFLQYGSELVCGRSRLLVVKENIIVAVDLANGLSMSYCKLERIKSVSWMVEDSVLSAVTADGLKTIDISNFIPFPAENAQCLTLSNSIFRTVKSNLKEVFGVLQKLKPMFRTVYNANSLYAYDCIFPRGIIYSGAAVEGKQDTDTASIVACSGNGKKAVAFEAQNVIRIFDASDKLIAVIDRLRLALNNNIMKLCFTLDSRYLLLWCNHFVKVFDIEKIKTVITLNLMKRPALDVWFDETSESLFITLYDKENYRFDLKSGKPEGGSLPKKRLGRIDFDNNSEYWGPYNILLSDEGATTFSLLAESNYYPGFGKGTEVRTPQRWFIGFNSYFSLNDWLLYMNGEFYLNGDEPFAHKDVDFVKSLFIEQMHDSAPINSYLRNKNDLLSDLVEYGSRYLVLVSRLLNSIIAFDKQSMTVVSAYKINGNIIGCTYPDNTSIEVIIDIEPYRIRFNIRLYETDD